MPMTEFVFISTARDESLSRRFRLRDFKTPDLAKKGSAPQRG